MLTGWIAVKGKGRAENIGKKFLAKEKKRYSDPGPY